METTPKPDKYEVGTPPNWEEGVRNFRLDSLAQPGADALQVITGPCPRCGHPLSKVIEYPIVPALMASQEPAVGAGDDKIVVPKPKDNIVLVVVCNCSEAHEGAPAGTDGCGAYGGVTFPTLIAAKLTFGMHDADIWAEQLVHDQLPNTRKLAQQWGATVTALTGLFGAGVAINADTAVRSLTSGWAIAYGVVTALAVLAAAWAILLASQASQGRRVQMPPGVVEQIALRRTLIEEAQSQLHHSRQLTGVAVVFLIASFGVRWYGPQRPPSATARPIGVVAARSQAPNARLAPTWRL